jgi:HSP20 family protein
VVPIPGWGSDLDRFVERFFGESLEGSGLMPGAAIKMDFEDTTEAFVVRAEVPGIEPAELEISLVEDVLTLSGEKKHESSSESAGRSYSERAYGAFQRSFRLPGPVEAKAVKAAHKNGVVTITLPKAASARPTRIAVSGS